MASLSAAMLRCCWLPGTAAKARATLGQDGLALLWLEPWDGVTAIPFEQLHPHYIEICRRVRLGVAHGQITCLAAGSASPRIRDAAEFKGNTGDPVDARGRRREGPLPGRGWVFL